MKKVHLWAKLPIGEWRKKAIELGFSVGVKQGWLELSETGFGFMKTLCQFFFWYGTTANKSISFTTILLQAIQQ